MTDVAGVLSFDLLASVCRRHGFALLLRSNGKRTVEPFGNSGAHCASTPTALDVVEPANRYKGSRKERLIAGDLIARALIHDPLNLQAAAADALEQVGRRVDETLRRMIDEAA